MKSFSFHKVCEDMLRDNMYCRKATQVSLTFRRNFFAYDEKFEITVFARHKGKVILFSAALHYYDHTMVVSMHILNKYLKTVLIHALRRTYIRTFLTLL